MGPRDSVKTGLGESGQEGSEEGYGEVGWEMGQDFAKSTGAFLS